MAIVSDANILSSLAAADALNFISQVFRSDTIYIPSAVEQELIRGLQRGAVHIDRVLQAIQAGILRVVALDSQEQALAVTLPPVLHAGEREGIALCQLRKHIFI